MDKTRFWEVVESVKWARPSTDYDKAKAYILRNYSFTELKELRAHLRDAYKAADAAASKIDIDCGSDDGWSDLIYHVVGLGKEFFDKAIENPLLIKKLYDTDAYVESFSYAIPYADDVCYLSNEYYQHRGTRYLSQLWQVYESPNWSKAVKEEVYKLIQLLEGQRDPKGWLAEYDRLFPKGNKEPIWSAEWNPCSHGIPNLFSDVRRYLVEPDEQ